MLLSAPALHGNNSSTGSRLCGAPPPTQHPPVSTPRAYAAWSSAEADEAVPSPDGRDGFNGQHALGVGLPLPDAGFGARASSPASPSQMNALDPGTP